MRFVLLCSLFFIYAPVALAFYPVFVEPSSADDYTVIDTTKESLTYYGTLSGHPHTYSFSINHPTAFSATVLIPEKEGQAKNISGIIVRHRENGRGVEEVSRLPAKTASWEPFHEWYGNDTYRIGSNYDATLEPGSYLLEVSSPENMSQYVLAIGDLEAGTDMGYFELLGNIYSIKQFFGQSGIMMIKSPLVYWPLILLLVVIVLVRYVGWWLVQYLCIAAAVLGFGWYAISVFDKAFGEDRSEDPVACTMEAKMCPDGSAVGRSGPNCEFAPCPGE